MISFGNKQFCEYCLNEWGGEPCRYCGYDNRTFKKEPAILPPGSILMGKYIVGKVMGKGGFGITYLAYDINNNRKVALKEYYPISYSARADDGCTVAVSRSEDSNLYYNGMKKFYDEASLVSKFNGNPNIVSVYEFFYENGTAYFVMELLTGYSLKSYIDKHGALTPEQTLYVADKVSNALMVAHSSNTLHRDIAPDNIMICTNGDVKLIDFGAARQVSAEDQKSLSVILKQGFAPLEQYQKHGNQGPWTDLYSLGATLYYATTKACIEDPMTRLDGDDEFQSNPCSVEPQLWEIIKRATNLKIEDRYKDAFEFRSDLNKIAYKAQEIKAESVDAEGTSMPAMSAAVPQPAPNTGYPQPNAPVTGYPQSNAPVAGYPQSNAPVTSYPQSNAPAAGYPQSSAPAAGYPQPAQPNAGYSGTPQQTVSSPYSAQPQSGSYPPPPAVKKAGKGKIFGILGGIAALIVIVIVIVVSTASPSEVTIGGVTYSVKETELDLSGMGLDDDDIAGLKYFTELETLYLNENNITDLSVLKGLDNLRRLYFYENDVSSLDFVKGLKKLERINFYGNKISDLSPLSGLKNIVEIWAGVNPISDISALKSLTTLEDLSLGGASIKNSDLSALSGLKNLRQIVLNDCGISDISALSGLKNLSYIDLGYCFVYDISVLEECTEIHQLLMRHNEIDTEEHADMFFSTLDNLNYAADAELDIRDIGWYYLSIEKAQNKRKSLVSGLEAKGYDTSQFQFWCDWENSSGDVVGGLVQ